MLRHYADYLTSTREAGRSQVALHMPVLNNSARHFQSKMKRRLDRLTAILIDTVIDNHAQGSTFIAASILAKNDVPLTVALRVLTRPWEARNRPTPALVRYGK
jgi:hypothetical protein